MKSRPLPSVVDDTEYPSLWWARLFYRVALEGAFGWLPNTDPGATMNKAMRFAERWNAA